MRFGHLHISARSAKSRDSKFHTRTHGLLTTQLVAWLHGRDRSAHETFFSTRYKRGEEDMFQIDLLDVLYAVMADDFEAIHIPSGGKRSPRTGAYLKRTGARAGVYDLYCGWTGGEGWLELKAGDNKPNRAQIEFGGWLRTTQKHGRIARTIAQALWLLMAAGAPLDPRFHPLAALGRPDGAAKGAA